MNDWVESPGAINQCCNRGEDHQRADNAGAINQPGNPGTERTFGLAPSSSPLDPSKSPIFPFIWL